MAINVALGRGNGSVKKNATAALPDTTAASAAAAANDVDTIDADVASDEAGEDGIPALDVTTVGQAAPPLAAGRVNGNSRVGGAADEGCFVVGDYWCA